MIVDIPAKLAARLRAAAKERGQAPREMASEILETIIEDNLFLAVLGEAPPPEEKTILLARRQMDVYRYLVRLEAEGTTLLDFILAEKILGIKEYSIRNIVRRLRDDGAIAYAVNTFSITRDAHLTVARRPAYGRSRPARRRPPKLPNALPRGRFAPPKPPPPIPPQGDTPSP